jgi:hypothetical protein
VCLDLRRELKCETQDCGTSWRRLISRGRIADDECPSAGLQVKQNVLCTCQLFGSIRLERSNNSATAAPVELEISDKIQYN